jgi:hypothetical protein
MDEIGASKIACSFDRSYNHRFMQPSALSVEPLLIVSAIVFLCVVLPLAVAVVVKCRPSVRAMTTLVGLIALVYVSFNLGRMTGLSMAWYHWKAEYKEPLWELQAQMNESLKSKDTNAIVKFAERFSKENVQAYGREKLFKKGEFHSLVEELRTP